VIRVAMRDQRLVDRAHRVSRELQAGTIWINTYLDGPAELPRVTVPSAMSDTPAPGSIINRFSSNSGEARKISTLRSGKLSSVRIFTGKNRSESI